MAGMLAEVAEQSRTDGGRVLLPGGRTVPDVSLVTGRHLRPGAVYDASDEEAQVRFTVKDWDRRRGVRLEHVTTAPDGTIRLVGLLKDARRPRLVEVDGTVQGVGALPWLGCHGRRAAPGWTSTPGGPRRTPECPRAADPRAHVWPIPWHGRRSPWLPVRQKGAGRSV